MQELIFLTEWKGKLFTPLGSVKRWAKISHDARVSELPEQEGLYGYTVTPESAPGKGDATLDLVEHTQLTPRDENVDISSLEFYMDGAARVYWPKGLTIIMGGAGTGKSLLVPKLARALQANVTLIGEPGPGSAPFFASAFSAVLNAALFGTEQCHVIDSMRMATFGGSQLGAGGIPRDMGSQLSQIDYACRTLGKAVFGVVNLLTNDERAKESAREAISGSVTAVMTTETAALRDRSKKAYRIMGTTTIRPTDRANNVFYVDVTGSY